MSDESVTRSLGWFVVASVLVLPLAAWGGFVVATLWRWFVVPLGVVHVGTWAAAGILLLARMLTFDPTLSREDESSSAEKVGLGVVYGFLIPALALGFGAIYHGFA